MTKVEKVTCVIKRILGLFLLSLSACAHSSIIPFQTASAKSYAPTQAKDVGIYQVARPYASFTELGIISYRAGDFDLVEMYNQIRKDAAEFGAQAVIDVKVTKETHIEMVEQDRCGPKKTCEPDGTCATENDCHSEQVPTEVSSFLITGSMIRGKI